MYTCIQYMCNCKPLGVRLVIYNDSSLQLYYKAATAPHASVNTELYICTYIFTCEEVSTECGICTKYGSGGDLQRSMHA